MKESNKGNSLGRREIFPGRNTENLEAMNSTERSIQMWINIKEYQLVKNSNDNNIFWSLQHTTLYKINDNNNTKGRTNEIKL